MFKILFINNNNNNENSASASEFYNNNSNNNNNHHYVGDSGIDIYCVEDLVCPGNQTTTIKFGIKVVYTSGGSDSGEAKSWMLFPRSSISNTPLRMANSIGLIDAGYRGEIMAKVDNIRNEDYVIKKGDRLFQMVSFGGESNKYTIVDEMDATERGEGGFGSTN